jgi:hypothetical protein
MGIQKHKMAKNFICFPFEKNQESYRTTMAIPTFEVSGIKPKSTSLKEGKLTIDGSDLGMKYQGVWNESTSQIEGTYSEGGVKLVLALIIGCPNSLRSDNT